MSMFTRRVIDCNSQTHFGVKGSVSCFGTFAQVSFWLADSPLLEASNELQICLQEASPTPDNARQLLRRSADFSERRERDGDPGRLRVRGWPMLSLVVLHKHHVGCHLYIQLRFGVTFEDNSVVLRQLHAEPSREPLPPVADSPRPELARGWCFSKLGTLQVVGVLWVSLRAIQKGLPYFEPYFETDPGGSIPASNH